MTTKLHSAQHQMVQNFTQNFLSETHHNYSDTQSAAIVHFSQAVCSVKFTYGYVFQLLLCIFL